MIPVLLTIAPLLSAPGFAQEITRPEAHLGRPVGVDFELADWDEVSSYFTKLGEESPCISTNVIGTTTEGRDFQLATISSPENLARLPELRGYARTIADPRGKTDAEKREAIEKGKVFLFISCAMHATETASPQMAMELAYTLATSEEEPWKSARENTVILLAPSLNPDGQDHVVSWYRETVGTPYEASGLLKLYQYYAGHDNNRDWFMLTQAETRIVTEQLYKVWHPQVYWDVHQQGSGRERMFVPPFRDPLNPNLDPGIISGIDALGSRTLLDLTRGGFQGISTGVSYDMWWNGGNRNVPVRHNIIGLLTEAASVDIASPKFLPISSLSSPRGINGNYEPSNRFPDPWPGGWWRLRDIIDYELGFGESLIGSLTRERELWLTNALEASERTIAAGREGAPRAWILPSDNRDAGAVHRLLYVLTQSGVELHVSPEELTVDGRTWPAGSVVIQSAQPYGAYVKDLFEVQEYPDGDPPYDVAGWTLPFLLGVHRVAVMTDIESPLERVGTATAAVEAFGGDERISFRMGQWFSSRESNHWPLLLASLEAGERWSFVTTGPRAGIWVQGEGTTNPDEEAILVKSMPRVGVYAPWSGSMDEGWLRYVFDRAVNMKFTRVRNEMLRAGDLRDLLDVLVIPSISGRQLDAGRREGSVPERYTGGLDPEGAIAVEEFVRQGGRLVTLGSSSSWAIDLFGLPLVDVTRGEDAADFACPGSVLRGIPTSAGLAADLPDSVPLFFSRSTGWRQMTTSEAEEAKRKSDVDMRTLLSYAPTRLLLSGWISSPEVLEGSSAWIEANVGQGSVHLFGFRPQYRGWSQGTFHLIMRAILID
jgi:hypothetical protein